MLIEWVVGKKSITIFNLGKALVTFVKLQAFVIEVIKSFEGFTHTDRPVHWVAGNTKHFFQLFQEVKWLTSITVQFVHEGEDRNTTVFDNFEKFFGLGLNTFG